MRRAVWLTLAVAVNAVLATLSSANTNSCISATDGFWDEARLWSLGKAPSIKQSAILITNAASETITIDGTTATKFKSTLTISNLSVSAPSGSTDTLYLVNTGTTALHIIDGLAIGVGFDNFGDRIPAGGELISSNSTLIVDGLLGGRFDDEGTIVITGGSLITTNCSLQVAGPAPTFYPATGLLVISNSIVQARDVSIGLGTISASSGTMEIVGGKMTCSGLSIGISNFSGSGGLGTFLVAGGCMLVDTNGGLGVINGSMTVTNASFLGTDVLLGDNKAGGELVINNGTVNLSGGIYIGISDLSSGSVSLNGGLLVVTNNIITAGAEFTGGGNFTVSDGTFLGQSMFLSDCRFSIQGGTSSLSSTLDLGFGAIINIGGGQLFVTNALTRMFSGTQCIVTGGQLMASMIDMTSGTLSVNGGAVTASIGITLENCGVCRIFLSGGQLVATNVAHTGFIDIRGGQLVLSGGTLQVDKLVMTNSCSQFIHAGGTLVVGSVVLDPNAFAVTSVAREGNDLRVTWLMGPGATNALQVSSGGSFGGYATNGFADVFVVTNNTTAGTATNFLDVGAGTNKPARYYRARLGF